MHDFLFYEMFSSKTVCNVLKNRPVLIKKNTNLFERIFEKKLWLHKMIDRIKSGHFQFQIDGPFYSWELGLCFRVLYCSIIMPLRIYSILAAKSPQLYNQQARYFDS